MTRSPTRLFLRISLAMLLAPALALALGLGTVASAQTNRVGINGHDGEEAVLDMASDLGLTWVRVDANWRDMEPADGTYNWYLDEPVRNATARGLSLYVTLAYTPDWVARVPRTRTDTYGGNDEPLGSAEWVSFVEEAVRHHRAMGVTHFGLWNEPNLGGFWDGNADAYIDKVVIPGSEAVRRVCGDCVVLGPDLAHVGDYHLFLERVLSRARDRFDVLAHHIYNGFPETGTGVFDGDNFVQALEMRRFSFTRPGLREVLDAGGWTGDVWITETGYRASRIGDATDEGKQAIYVRRVLEEQLARDWWTNTFFYEAVDCGVEIPDCDIDGFGITRPSRARPRTFPADFRTKPAYAAIGEFITAHPELTGEEPPPPPPAGRAFVAVPRDAIVVDGELGDWADTPFVALSAEDWDGDVAYGGAADLSVRAAFAWRAGTLFIAVEATDDTHDNARDDDTLWAGDSLQIAFDVNDDGGTGYGADDHELTFALARDAGRVRREQGPATAPLPGFAIVRTGTRTVYELAFSDAAIPPAMLRAGARLGASFVVNDADGAGRDGWLQASTGIARGKVPEDFVTLSLEATDPPPAGDGGIAPGMDGGSGADGGVGSPGGDAGGVGGPPGGGDGGGGGGGCACSASAAGAPDWLVPAVALAGLLARRRRRVG